MTNRKKKILVLTAVIVLTVLAVVLSYLGPYLLVLTVARPVRVEGDAMKPSLNNGDRIFVTPRFDSLERGDVVIFYYPLDTSKSYLKRIIGLPEEEIEIRGHKVFINSKLIEEPYINQAPQLRPGDAPAMRIPAQEYFVMGDNRDYSADSRSFGTIPRNLIYGKYVFRYHTAPPK